PLLIQVRRRWGCTVQRMSFSSPRRHTEIESSSPALKRIPGVGSRTRRPTGRRNAVSSRRSCRVRGETMRALVWLALIARPVYGAELQIDLSGNASSQDGGPTVPFTVSFGLDTLAGAQTYSLSGCCLSAFSASTTLTDFSADFGGSAWHSPSLSASLSGQAGGA